MIYLLSYTPMANSKHGREVAAHNGIPPYVDASCRREPDFELPEPFISGLCRPSFVAHLELSDTIVYITNKSEIRGEKRRLVAILQLNQMFPSHEAAASHYSSLGVRVPYSCILERNPPLPIHMTNPKMTKPLAKFKITDSRVWDRLIYRQRARDCQKCFSCGVIFREVTNPPIVAEGFLAERLGSGFGYRMQRGGLILDGCIYNALLERATSR